MLQHPIMIEPNRRVVEAQKIMVDNHIYYLPVVGDGKRLIGIVTPPRLAISPDRLASFDVWEITRYLSDLTVDKVMLKGSELPSITPNATLEDAAEMMFRSNFHGLPVVEKGIVVGLITDVDLLIELRNLLGAVEPGYRVTVRVPSRRGEFLKLTRVITDKGWGIMAMGNVRSPKVPDHWDIVLKIWGCTETELIAALDQIDEQQVLDVRETNMYKLRNTR